MYNELYKDDVCFPKSIFSHVYDKKLKKKSQKCLVSACSIYTTLYCIRHIITYIIMYYIHCKIAYDIEVLKKKKIGIYINLLIVIIS